MKNIHKSFGGIKSLSEVTINVAEGNIHSLIGPNGAGKTTLINIISGIETADEGEIYFKSVLINKKPPHERAKKGIGRTFQHIDVFGEMSVLENIMVGFYPKKEKSFIKYALNLPDVRKNKKEILEKSKEILNYINLYERRDILAKNLPVGEQRILEIGRALAIEPSLLLLDEPAAGLNMRETRELGKLITKLRDERGITIFLIEHDMDLIMKISDKITVLNFGRVIAEGNPLEIQKNDEVIKAYIGEEE
ncbi:ABC transporter ATP-binding protein [Thermodesulfovibrio hydrogeniphilus]